LLVCSAPEYPFGNYDPVIEIAALASKNLIGCHVDSCIGFVNAFAEKAGYKIPLNDFRVPGVTSISVDTHKFAFGPKGYSVLLFRNASLRDYQFFNCMDWNGGFYATPSMAGSRPGNIIAGTWAAMMSFGQKKYIQ
jgi:sphinganine-1-phosphate aldolase